MMNFVKIGQQGNNIQPSKADSNFTSVGDKKQQSIFETRDDQKQQPIFKTVGERLIERF